MTARRRWRRAVIQYPDMGTGWDTRQSRPSYLAEPGLPGTPVIQPDVYLQRYTRRLDIGIGPPHPLDLRRDGAVVPGPLITAGRTERRGCWRCKGSRRTRRWGAYHVHKVKDSVGRAWGEREFRR